MFKSFNISNEKDKTWIYKNKGSTLDLTSHWNNFSPIKNIIDNIMWVFLNNSLSIVENRNNKEELLVRSRIKGDIEKVFPDSDVFEMENSDYKYRSFIKRLMYLVN